MAMPGKVPNRTSGAVWGSVSCPRWNADQGKSNQWPPDNMTLALPLSHKNIRFIAWLAKESEKVEWTRFIKKTQRACNVYTYSGHTESWERCLLCPGSAIINTFTLKLGYRETTIQTLNTCHLRLITACRLKLLCKLQWSKCISLLVISFPSMWLKTAVQHLWKQECSFFAPVTSVSADTPLEDLIVSEWVLVPRWTTGNCHPAESEMGQHHAIYLQERPAAYVLLVTAGKLQAATGCTAHVQHCNHGIHHHILNDSVVWLCNIAL